MRVGLVFEGCAEFNELIMVFLGNISEEEAYTYDEYSQTGALLSLDLVAKLLDVTEGLDDLGLVLVDQKLDLRDVRGRGVHQIVSDFCSDVFGLEWLSDSSVKIIMSDFPASRSHLASFLHEDVAPENPDDVVSVEHPKRL